MNVRVLIVIPLALVCGLSAMFLVKALRKPVAAPTIERTPVVFAIEDVKTGEMVIEKGVEIREVPTEQVPEDAVRRIADVLDRAAKSTIDKGDMLRELKLAEKGAGRGMAALITPGMRAVVIQTPSFSASLGGFLLPGNRVDINMSTSSGSGAAEPPRTILEDVKVLAVDRNVNQPAANKVNPEETRFVTVEVTPEDALKLDQGQAQGTLTLKLRNSADKAKGRADFKPIVRPKELTLADKLEPGMQAFTIDAGSFSATLASHLTSESRVDVLFTVPTDEKSKELTGGASTRTLLKNIRVLLVQPLSGEASKQSPITLRPDDPLSPIKVQVPDSRYVTLQVDANQARQLDLAQSRGKLHLSLLATVPPKSEDLPKLQAIRTSLITMFLKPQGKPLIAANQAVEPSETPEKTMGKDRDLFLANQLGMVPEPELPTPLPPLPPPIPLDQLISPGMQAFTLDAASFSAPVPNHFTADSRVDLLLTDARNNAPTAGGSTLTLLKNIRVLDSQPSRGRSHPVASGSEFLTHIILEVDEDQARNLELGQAMGKFRLVLRGAFPSRPDELTAQVNSPRMKPVSARERPVQYSRENSEVLTKMAATGPPVLTTMQVRTLRGTKAGQDTFTIFQAPR